MGRFDFNATQTQPWLTDRLVSDYFIEERRRASFLHRHFCGPGVLGGVDLADGMKCITIQPKDHAAYFLTHTLGPGRIKVAPSVTVRKVDGTVENRASFFWTTTRHADSEGKCSFAAFTFQNGNSLQPSPPIIKASRALAGRGIDHGIERSSHVGRWTIWIFFQATVQMEQAQAVGRTCREIISLAGVPTDEFQVPLLEENPSPIFLPYHFFCADYFGLLQSLDGGDLLVAMNPNSISLLDVSAFEPQTEYTTTPPKAMPVECNQHPWNAVLEAWHKDFGEKRVRAGELVSLLRESKLVPPDAPATWHDSSQAAAIWLGKRLQSLVGAPIRDFHIAANSSGNSTVFRLRRLQP